MVLNLCIPIVRHIGNQTLCVPFWKVEQRTISAGEATARQITLVNTPASAADVLVDVIHGSAQEYSVDYTITGAVLDWNGLALDGLLAAGDKLRVAYVY